MILLNSLKSGGVSIPADVSSIKDLTSETLVSICGQSLNLIFNTMTFGTSLPHSMAAKFKICTDISSAIKNLGYIGDISYYKVKTNNKKRANLTAYLAESFDFLMNLV